MFNIKIQQINNKSITNEGSFLQTPFWCNFKSRHGWKVFNFSVDVTYPESEFEKDCEHNKSFHPKEALNHFELSVLNRSFAKSLFSINYVPLMPSLPYVCTSEEKIEKAFENDKENQISVIDEELVTAETQTIEFANFVKELAANLKEFLPENSIAIRFDPDVSFYSLEERETFNYGMQLVSFADSLHILKCKNDIQPPDTSLVSLEGSEEEILGRMHSKWRYNIRLSEKKGVIIKKYSGNDALIDKKIDKFYELTKETNARDGNSSHAKSYYLDLIKSSASELQQGKDVPLVNLYIAESEGEEIAAIMTLFSKTESVYLYGASSNKKRNLMPNHLLQWTAIKDAKVYGSKYYDLYGMPPEGEDENHPMHGLYMFKNNFGGKNIHRTGSWDYPYKFIYRFYRTSENLRAFWHKKVLKKIRGR